MTAAVVGNGELVRIARDAGGRLLVAFAAEAAFEHRPEDWHRFLDALVRAWNRSARASAIPAATRLGDAIRGALRALEREVAPASEGVIAFDVGVVQIDGAELVGLSLGHCIVRVVRDGSAIIGTSRSDSLTVAKDVERALIAPWTLKPGDTVEIEGEVGGVATVVARYEESPPALAFRFATEPAEWHALGLLYCETLAASLHKAGHPAVANSDWGEIDFHVLVGEPAVARVVLVTGPWWQVWVEEPKGPLDPALCDVLAAAMVAAIPSRAVQEIAHYPSLAWLMRDARLRT